MQQSRVDEFSVEVAGGEIFVTRWQAAEQSARSPITRTPIAQSPIVLLHDSLGCVAMWRDFPALLAAQTGRQVIAYDRLGFGRSSAQTEAPDFHFIDIEARQYFPALCAALNLERVVLMGHSVGGAMALAIASDPAQSQRCAAVITESTAPLIEARTLAGIRAAQAEFRKPEQMARLSKYHGDKAHWVLSAWTDIWLDPAFAHWTLDPYLAGLRCPLLSLHGDADEFASAAAPQRIVQGAGAEAELALLEGVGHVPHREVPALIADLVLSFLVQQEID